MLPFTLFDAALPRDEFLTRFGTPSDRERWDRHRDSVRLTDEQKSLFTAFTRQTNVLVLAGAWCGDCSAAAGHFDRFAESAPNLVVRYLDRDAHPDAQQELKVNGGDRVPMVVFFSEDGFEVARYGDRPLAAYRRMMAGTVPQLPPPTGDKISEITADWLREFERVQWILRLSPRLRRLHGD